MHDEVIIIMYKYPHLLMILLSKILILRYNLANKTKFKTKQKMLVKNQNKI